MCSGGIACQVRAKTIIGTMTRPAADAQEAGQDAGDGAHSHIHQNNCQHVKFL